MKLSYLTLSQAATVTVVASLFAFALGAFVFPFSSTPPSVPPLELRGGKGGVSVDSLILSWMDQRPMSAYDAAGMTRVSPPIAGARIGFFPKEIRSLADSVRKTYGIPPAVILAQFALESRFGLSDLGALNFFGHTFPVAQLYGPKPAQRTMALTKEFVGGSWVTLKRPFAKYSSPGECFLVHGKFLSTSHLYKRALTYRNDPVLYAREIGRHYATDPDYSLKLITIMKRYQLAG